MAADVDVVVDVVVRAVRVVETRELGNEAALAPAGGLQPVPLVKLPLAAMVRRRAPWDPIRYGSRPQAIGRRRAELERTGEKLVGSAGEAALIFRVVLRRGGVGVVALGDRDATISRDVFFAYRRLFTP